VELNFNELRELVTTLSQSDISELTLKSTEFELTLRKQGALALPTAVETMAASQEPVTVQVTETPSASTPPASAPKPPPSVDSNLPPMSRPLWMWEIASQPAKPSALSKR